jgi:hypothetical protein
MSSTPKKGIPAKRPVTKGAPQRSATSKSPANKGVVKRPASVPTKTVKKAPTSNAPKQKPTPAKKPASEKQEKKEGSFFTKLFEIFKKKAPKEEVAKDSTPISETTEQIPNEPTAESEINTATTSETASLNTNSEAIVELEITNIPEKKELVADTAPESETVIESNKEIDSIVEETLPSLEELEPEPVASYNEESTETKIEEHTPLTEPVKEKPVETKIQETLFPIEEAEEADSIKQESIPVEEAVLEKEAAQTEIPIAQESIPEETSETEQQEAGPSEEKIIEQEQPKEEPIVYAESIPYPTKYNEETGENSEPHIAETADEKEDYFPFHESITSSEPELTVANEQPFISETTSHKDYITPTYSTYNETMETPAEKAFEESPAQQASSNEPLKKEEKKKKRGVLIPFFLVVSLIGNGVLAWLLMNKHEEIKTVIVLKDKVIQEKEDVMGDLLKLKSEYASLQTNNIGLQKELQEKRAEIDSMIEQAKKHKNDAYVIAKLKKETETLRSIMKHFVVEIDSLNTLNKTIVAEKNKVVEDLNSQITKTTELEKDNDLLVQTVNKGSVLKALLAKAEGIRMRGGVKEVGVKYAARAEKVKVTFTLSENSIAKKGMKTIYVRILGPDGREVTTSESDLNSVSFNGTKGFFAEKKDVEYQNVEMPVDIICGSPKGFISGKYIIDIICEGNVIGQTELMFK